MKIEKLTENKIRITLNLSDLEEEHIDLHSFMSNSAESQALFCSLLNKAEKEVGFYTKDYKLMIEAIAVPEGNFILTVTRLPEKEQVKKQLKIKRKKYMDIISIFTIRSSNRRTFRRTCSKSRLAMVVILWTKFWTINSSITRFKCNNNNIWANV